MEDDDGADHCLHHLCSPSVLAAQCHQSPKQDCPPTRSCTDKRDATGLLLTSAAIAFGPWHKDLSKTPHPKSLPLPGNYSDLHTSCPSSSHVALLFTPLLNGRQWLETQVSTADHCSPSCSLSPNQHVPWYLMQLTQNALSCALGGARGTVAWGQLRKFRVLPPILCLACLEKVVKSFNEVACSQLLLNAARLTLG